TNEMRRVGYPSPIRESRFRFFGTQASFEQLAHQTVWNTKEESQDVSERFVPRDGDTEDADLAGVDPALREAFTSGSAPVHDRTRLPAVFATAPNGHEGSHHFLADDFVRAIVTGTEPPVNARLAAAFTAPGIIAHASALEGGTRLEVPVAAASALSAPRSAGAAPPVRVHPPPVACGRETLTCNDARSHDEHSSQAPDTTAPAGRHPPGGPLPPSRHHRPPGLLL